MRMVSIMVCDDSPAVRTAVRRCLSTVPEVLRVSATASGEEMLARYPVEQPDVVFLDVQMPGMGGGEALRKLMEVDPRAVVVMMTTGEAPGAVAEAVTGGASGYLAKDASPQEMAAVLSTLTGRSAVNGVPQQRIATDPGLTERESQVLRGMSEGRSNAQIGKDLFLSEDTVKTHARRLFRKLDVSDRGHAVAEGLRRGLIT
jgi:DNA-binding NarL/FixJ family response regulator